MFHVFHEPGPGRPSLFSEELAEQICEMLMSGLSLRKICLSPDMPHRGTVERWMAKDPVFASRCARARVWQADVMDDLILDTANACTPETAQSDRVKISAYQWRASKLAPKVYGDKIAVVGANDGPIQSVAVVTTDPIEAARAYQKFIEGE